MDNLVFVVAIVVLVVVVAVLAWGFYAKRKRTKEMRAVASSLGYEFAEEDARLVETLSGLPLYSRGRGRKAANLLNVKAEGVAAALFDFTYETGQRKNRSTVSQSALLFESERLDLPPFALSPEGLGQKFEAIVGQQDIDFEGQPEFSGAYVLQSPDEARARALFGDEALAFFARRKGLNVEGGGQRLLYYRAKKLVAPDEVASFVQEGQEVLRLLGGEQTPQQ